jgi:chemotaxis response regulator CheB
MVGPAVILHFLPDGFYRGYCIDALFQSLGRHAGPRTIGVILSGILKDGSPGLSAIKEAGGLAFVQVPGEAEYKDMPSNAVAFDGPIDLVGSFQAIAEEIRLRTETPPSLPADLKNEA